MINLTIIMLEKTGVFTTACDTWRVKPPGDKTLANFKLHFTQENEERVRKLTAQSAGFHGANSAAGIVFDPLISPAVPATAAAATGTPTVTTNCNTKMYYCWTHGLGINNTHTSATCQHKGIGHKDTATVMHMQGGNNTIYTGARRRIPNADGA